MNKTLALLCIASLFGRTWMFAEVPASNDKLAALKALKIDHASNVQVERDPTSTRTIVKLMLRPAKG